MKMQRTFDNALIGKNVKLLRKQKNMKQDELAVVLGDHSVNPPIPLSRSQVSNLENNRRTWNINQIHAVAKFFGTSIECLGVPSTQIEIPDLLARTKLIFENENVPLEEKQELYEEVMKLYLSAKEQIKK